MSNSLPELTPATPDKRRAACEAVGLRCGSAPLRPLPWPETHPQNQAKPHSCLHLPASSWTGDDGVSPPRPQFKTQLVKPTRKRGDGERQILSSVQSHTLSHTVTILTQTKTGKDVCSSLMCNHHLYLVPDDVSTTAK